MKKFILVIALVLCLAPAAYARNIYSQGFEGNFPPSGWTLQQTNPDNTWFKADGTFNGDYGGWEGDYQMGVMYSAHISSEEDMITPLVDLTTADSTEVSFACWGNYHFTSYSTASLNVSTDFGDKGTDASWTRVWTYPGTCPTTVPNQWCAQTVDLSDYDGQQIWLDWKYKGRNGYAFGMD
jgi:hypothetical protein